MKPDRTSIERFDGLFAAHFDAVRAYAWRRDPSNADDVAAETFLVAWRRLEDVPTDALPWLIGVARNVRLNVLRAERRRTALGARLAERSAPALVESTTGTGAPKLSVVPPASAAAVGAAFGIV